VKIGPVDVEIIDLAESLKILNKAAGWAKKRDE